MFNADSSMTEKLSWEDRQKMHAEAKKEIRKIMTGLKSGGDFCFADSASMPIPGLQIDSIGDISFPLLPSQAQAIKDIASQAPYGRGAQTLVDLSIRNTLQIEASQVSFKNPDWREELSRLMNTACVGLGIDFSEVQPVLYKILLYEKGCHFKAHKDSEKQDGMFGTFVLQFPSSYTGGEVVVQHCGIQREISLGVEDQSCARKYHYMAHYADCEHEIKEVKEGYRLVAIYSLCWRGRRPAPSAPLIAPVEKLAFAMKKAQYSLAVMLKHEYSHQSFGKLGFGALKGVDRAIAGTLMATSKMLAAKNPEDEFVFYIIQAIRVCPEIHFDHYSNFPNPRVEEKYYGPEGFTTGEQYKHFDFEQDVMNCKFDYSKDLEKKLSYGGSDSCSKQREQKFKDKWWRADGWTEDYMGNEGSEQKYECFVLVFYRRAILQT